MILGDGRKEGAVSLQEIRISKLNLGNQDIFAVEI
ncbi:hypothetical protein NIES2135_22470 [Leptolyngbya boryana NIES-2135]|jgi:hypothetical protein|uniref:Uncharacterized protein n=1 Tax=Leptolyngbya boryana NIES-2135 TaxID=1973484 RepID=A0A1Z4JF84_LEPBY|nr:hypothetical protein NIES2135_22470 [Leptolyngbya boryana NIES-2135]